MDQLDLSPFFQTKAQAHDFSLRLDAISEKIYVTGFNLEKALMEQFGIQKKDKFISFLRDSNISFESNSNLKNTIATLQKNISSLPVISLTLAIEPNDHIISALSDWFAVNLKKQVLLDIQVDAPLIGGALLTYSGKYADFSLKPIFEEVLKNESAAVPAVKNNQINHQINNATPLNDYQGVAHA